MKDRYFSSPAHERSILSRTSLALSFNRHLPDIRFDAHYRPLEGPRNRHASQMQLSVCQAREARHCQIQMSREGWQWDCCLSPPAAPSALRLLTALAAPLILGVV